MWRWLARLKPPARAERGRLHLDREEALAVWRAATDDGVNRSDSGYEWLRR